MFTVLYFQKIKNRVYCRLLASFGVYTVRFLLRENQENYVTKRSAFLFALKSTFNVRDTVTIYNAPKERIIIITLKFIHMKKCVNLLFYQNINVLFCPASIILFCI